MCSKQTKFLKINKTSLFIYIVKHWVSNRLKRRNCLLFPPVLPINHILCNHLVLSISLFPIKTRKVLFAKRKRKKNHKKFFSRKNYCRYIRKKIIRNCSESYLKKRNKSKATANRRVEVHKFGELQINLFMLNAVCAMKAEIRLRMKCNAKENREWTVFFIIDFSYPWNHSPLLFPRLFLFSRTW